MVRVSFWFFGYRIFEVNDGFEKIPSLLFNKKISFISDKPGILIISERNLSDVEKLLKKKFTYSVSESLGFGGAVRRIKCKRGLALGVLMSLVLSLILTNLVWEVNVEGNSSITDAEISEKLSECGFDIGDFWPFVNRSKIEKEFLLKFQDISWININRRGSVAYVVVSEKSEIEDNNENKPASGYANIVATVGCIIEEITVKHGQAEVKPGDSVKAGDILISGVLPETSGGGFCYAEGTVIGRLYERIEAEISREYEKTLEKKLHPIKSDIKIFNLNINIFKNYRNSYDGCDIIDDVKVFSLFGDKTFPLSLNTKYALECVTEKAFYTDEELVRLASSTLSAKTTQFLNSSDLLRIKTDGEFTDAGYKMYSDLVFLSEVGMTSEFYAD